MGRECQLPDVSLGSIQPFAALHKTESPFVTQNKYVTNANGLKFHNYGFHDAVSFTENFDNALVVADIVVGEFAGLAVFQPFLRRLIASDIKLPSNLRHIFKILLLVYSLPPFHP